MDDFRSLLEQRMPRGGPAQPQEKSFLDIGKAMREITTKTEEQIEQETAITWAARAVACYQLVLRSVDRRQQTLLFSQADDFKHEALEHASLAGDRGQLLNQLATAIEESRNNALEFVK